MSCQRQRLLPHPTEGNFVLFVPKCDYFLGNTFSEFSEFILDSLEIFFQEFENSREFVRRLRSVRLKRSEVYADFAKLKRMLRSFRLKCFKV